jgi:hypothetical protein
MSHLTNTELQLMATALDMIQNNSYGDGKFGFSPASIARDVKDTKPLAKKHALENAMLETVKQCHAGLNNDCTIFASKMLIVILES